MAKWIDIMIMPEGVALTLLRFFQVGVCLIKTDQMDYSGDTYESKALDISVSIYKFSTHLHFSLSERNKCRDVTIAKS